MISLVDTGSILDDRGEPIGHGLKVLKELPELFEGDIEILAGKAYIAKLQGKGRALPCSRYPGTKNENFKMICNYFASLILAKGDVLVYTYTLEALLWGIALFKGKRKIVAVTYENWNSYIRNHLSDKPFRRFLVRKGLNNLDGCIVTNYTYKPKVPYIRLPDYFITDQILKYRKEIEKNGCICLGEIRGSKDIEGFVRVMRKTDIPVLIAGKFQSRETYTRIRGLQTENIKIENKNLPYDIYMEYLSEYKYVVLPYDMKCYDGRTSGVLLEGIFLGAVPIAPKRLLEQNKIRGLGYNTLSDIPELIRSYEEGDITIANKLEGYQMERCKKRLQRFMNQLNAGIVFDDLQWSYGKSDTASTALRK